MSSSESLKAQILDAFASVPYPGDDHLRGSDMGDEPYLLEAAFRGKTDWRALDASFLDLAPDGFASALSFFSRDAFRFYLPAYLIADLDEALFHCDPVFHLWFGLDDANKDTQVNPRLYGDWTWFEAKHRQFAVFTAREAAAIVAYLQHVLNRGTLPGPERRPIEQALRNYWLERASAA